MIDPLGAETGPAYQTLGHVDALPAGTRLGEFEVQGLLGFGGFGMVYRGYDHSLERAVAIKEYMPSALVARSANHELSVRSPSDAQSFQAGLTSFIAEARLLARFDHPSLVKVYRFWEANNTAYMAMPLYQGITLKQARLQMSAPPPEDWLRVVLWSVLEALKVLHSSDALHRDVSPDNIFLQDQGPPVLLDLGAARLAVMEGHKKHTAVLKVSYAPIEQYADASDMREGPWTDIYALAAVVHGCICNEAPLPATFRVVRDRLPSMAKIAKTTETHFGQSYSSSFIKAMDHALAIQPGNRPASVDAFAKELRLRSVSHPQRFDWRSALGDRVSLSGAGVVAAAVSFGASASVDETIPFSKAKAVAVAAKGPTVNMTPAPTRVHPSGLRRWWWIGAISASVVLAGLLTWTSRPPGMAPAAVGLPSASVSAPENTPSDAAIPVQATLSANESTVALVPLLPASAMNPGPVVLVQPRSASKAPVKIVKPAEEPRASTVKPAPESAPAPASKTENVEPLPQEAPKPKRDAQSLCPDSNVFTRPMCVYRECQKPEFKSLQVCIDDRKHWEERDKANRSQ
jgi:serine/threonine protein kinase